MHDSQMLFQAYAPEHGARCLEVFDANCPEYFAPNERDEYAAFLDGIPDGYEVCVVDGRVAGAFGLIDEPDSGLRLNWILIDPAVQGRGVGSAMMQRVVESARARFDVAAGPGAAAGRAEALAVDIAASHRSAPFFARFGAQEVRHIADGWGPGMHRVDMRLPV